MDSSAGLTLIEAKARLAQNGPNSVDTKSQNSKIRLLLRQFESPIILILFAATIVSMFAGEITDGAIILAIIIPSGLLGFWQENRVGKTMQALLNRVQVYVEVIRDGAEIKIPVAEIVVGDLVVLRIGDVVPADLQVVKSEGLMADEFALTGESFPREKIVGEIDHAQPLAERASELFFGTHVVSGLGQGLVIKAGENTEFGALSKEVNSRDVTTGFERGITAFGRCLLAISAVASDSNPPAQFHD